METPCDEARDYWENREGRWERVHNIARRTLCDPMHDEQPFCHNFTERRRTTVKFLGQQSEMMPQDDTWEPNRHHRRTLALFRSHLTRDTAAMFPLFQNPVASTEHEC